MSKKNFSHWAKENRVVLVVIPLLVAIHWGWSQLQKVPYLVPQTEKQESPIIKAYQVYKSRIMQKIESLTQGSSSEE